ncbi:MAG: SCO family protein [Castellaniella sp.]|uniref:SCO family protein n=1 Tax=Castellaniella sp. TaxID=1955812 RepID=UPI002A3625B8|nr:SCO family protein [Castellaniella sp.]MDY0309355.1 SCO family protein [Castellaniella sp.]
MSLSIPRRRLLACTLAALPLALVLPGCTSETKPLPFAGNDITGSRLGRDLNMVDMTGQQRTLADFKGKILLVFFGYTQCPDICPTALAQAAQTMQLLGDQADEVRVIMVSVDPLRDTPEILNTYVHAFDPSFIGLTGTPEQLEKTARSFKAYYAKEPGPTPEHYAMNHSSAFYLMDRDGEARALLGPSLTPEDMAHDIRLLL